MTDDAVTGAAGEPGRARRLALRAPALLVMSPLPLVLGAVVAFLGTYGDPVPGQQPAAWPLPVGGAIMLLGVGLWVAALVHAVIGVREAVGGPRVVAGVTLAVGIGAPAALVLMAVLSRGQVR